MVLRGVLRHVNQAVYFANPFRRLSGAKFPSLTLYASSCFPFRLQASMCA